MDYGELKQNCSLITLNEDSKIYTAGKLADSFGNIINGQEVITSSFVNGISLPSVQVEPDYLRFTAEEEDSSIRFCHYWSGATVWTGSCPIEYSIDNCSTWYNYGPIQNHSGTIINLHSGDTVYLRNKNSKRYGVINNGTSSSTGNNIQFKITGKVRADGNIMSLIDKDCVCTSLGYYAFIYLFSGCTSLTKAPDMPATSMGTYAYYYMYKACTNLKTAPKILPAKGIPSYAYEGMFYGCTNLETGPLINASFFQNSYSFRSMFYNCQKLKKLGMMVLNAPTTANTSNWLYGTTGSSVTGRTIYLASGTTWNPASSVHGVPSNWTKIYI